MGVEEKREVRGRVEAIVFRIVRAAMSEQRASVHVGKVRHKFPGLSPDALAGILIKRAVRKTTWEGGGSGLAISGSEAVLLAPLPEPSHKVAAASAVAGLIAADASYTTSVQMQLLLDIAHLYDCPYDRDDEDDVWLIFKAALGTDGTARVGGWGRFIFNEAARKQFRKLLRTGIRRAVQQYIRKAAGPRVAKYLGERYAMRLIPVANAVIGARFNNWMTKGVGKRAKVNARIRSATFRQIDFLKAREHEATVWVLPLIYWIGTADDTLTDNVLSLYASSSTRLVLPSDAMTQVEALIDSDDFHEILKQRLPKIRDIDARKALLNIALTAAAVDLTPKREYHECLNELSNVLGVKYDEGDLEQKIKDLQA